MLDRIPLEMRTYPQWIVWRYEEQDGAKPTKVPYSARTGGLADVTEPQTWTSYDDAVSMLQRHPEWYSGLGFVLSDNDPYTFIDLDDPYEIAPNGQPKHSNPEEIMRRQIDFFNQSQSYAERSPSGKGLHIIMRGAVPSGRRRSAIEVYSSQRYMTMTGDVYRDAPIIEENELISVLWNQIGEGKKAQSMFAGLEIAKYLDDDILKIASTAANAEKFNDLFFEGNWQKYYPSQSEADFALVDMLAFYSENRAQVQKLFLQSKLGQREKSRAQYRINYMLNRCFDRMLPPIDMDGLRNQLEEALERKRREREAPQEVQAPPKPIQEAPALPPPSSNVYSAPPGLVGEIAKFIYAAAPRPVPEIALAGAIGFLAGIVGRAYNISGTGLNQYMLLLAPTGTGKEAIASGVDKLINAVLRTVPAAGEFVGPGEIASSQALIKYLGRTAASFVSLTGEFGLLMQQMCAPNAPPHLVGLRRILLDLYNKSGEGKVLRPSIYSDREKNTASVIAPAFTLMGESTPERFYDSLNEGMISEGLLPRFSIIEYHGIRPELNPAHTLAQPSFEVVEMLSTLCAHALMLNSQHKAVHVTNDAQAQRLFDDFDKHCDLNINSSDKEVRRHLWNRAHIKAMKMAALVAVGINPYNPTITGDVAQWAINLVVADVRNLLKRFDNGEIGIDNDETKQLSKVIEAVKDYVLKPWSEVQKYSTSPASMHNEKIIPFAYISRRLAAVAVFRKDRAGSARAIDRAIKTLCDRGDIQEVNRATLSKEHGTSARAYMIASPRAFGLS